MATTAFDMANSVANNNVYNEYYAGAANVLNQVDASAQSNSAQMRSNAALANELQMAAFQNTMAFNSSEAARNRAWQEYMSNTAHQREVRDLQAAGLNPVLSASGGNGAAVGSGATASVSTPQMQKADVDTGYTQGLVSFLTSMINAQTQLQASNISALNNLAVADKYTAMNKYVADVNAEVSRYGIDVGARNNALSASAMLGSAATSAAATRAAAAQNAGATMYAADQSRASAAQSADAAYWSAIKSALINERSNAFATIPKAIVRGVENTRRDFKNTLDRSAFKFKDAWQNYRKSPFGK